MYDLSQQFFKFPDFSNYLSLQPKFEPETLIYAATHAMTYAEMVILDLEIKEIKRPGGSLTISSLTAYLSLAIGFYFPTHCSVDLNRYTGIPGVRFSFAATGTPAVTAVFSGVTAGTGETLGSDVYAGFDFTSGYTTINATVNDSNTFTTTGINGAVAKSVAETVGALYKFSFLANETGGVSLLLDNAGSFSVADGSVGVYRTVGGTGSIRVRNSVSGIVVDVTTLSGQKVLTPDTTGFTASALTNGGINPNATSFVCTITKP